MATLPDFKLETHFSKWEFKAKFHLSASDAQSLSLAELLSMANDEDRENYESMWLGYTETFGAPALRNTIAATYDNRKADDILCFAGASEGIFAANQVLLDKDSHAIVVTPNYQSHESLPLALCKVSGVPLDSEDGWSLDIDRVAHEVRANTKLITINFPHNPTGAILALDRYMSLIELCRKHGIYLLHDEIFNGLGRTDTSHLPFVADLYERGLSLNVMSKSFGLPGLRIGWIACQDTALLSKMERLKHYLSICNSGPSEHLAKIALKNKDKLLSRNCAIVDENLPKWRAFFSRHPELFEWYEPDGSCMVFPRYIGPGNVDQFTQKLVENSGVLVLPSGIYQSQLTSTPVDRFRIGYGRRALDKGIAAFDQHLSD